MELLEIKNFLTITEASFELKKINIIIGPQAKGKSIVAKLLYFFKNTFSESFVLSVENLETKRELQKRCLAKFEQIFPKYSWANQAFRISYTNGDFNLSIAREKKNSNFVLTFDYCKKLNDFHRKLKVSYKDSMIEYEKKISHAGGRPVFRGGLNSNEVILEKLNNSQYGACFNRSIFIPATRSFFANLQKNVFSFLASNIEIDPFIKEFGSKYESSKRVYGGRVFKKMAPEEFNKKLERLTSEIAAGDYVYADEKDWIQTSSGVRTNLSNASSGQQESVPMLVILSVWPYFYGKERPGTFIIEEPEAHLFPTSQKHIASLISLIYNEFNHSFFITTHSPYILTAINNLIAAHDAYEKVKDDEKKTLELSGFCSKDESIAFEEVSAYTIERGRLVSIMDDENRIIGASVLDEVSDSFDRVFDKIAGVLYGDEE